mmetsp:Transcript_9712/g.41659  ORF Transcript_9712/g.41659 Transcript_9712/m.41659 type:complete len:219 (+) Transcript_9712:548-1204(+)
MLPMSSSTRIDSSALDLRSSARTSFSDLYCPSSLPSRVSSSCDSSFLTITFSSNTSILSCSASASSCVSNMLLINASFSSSRAGLMTFFISIDRRSSGRTAEAFLVKFAVNVTPFAFSAVAGTSLSLSASSRYCESEDSTRCVQFTTVFSASSCALSTWLLCSPTLSVADLRADLSRSILCTSTASLSCCAIVTLSFSISAAFCVRSFSRERTSSFFS